jgi:adenylate kinase family enzyme
VQRVSVVGNSGSGKTTLAAALAARLGVPHLELDSVFHQPNWEPLPAAEFRARVGEFAAGPGWVADGNYSAVQDLLWQRADTVVWLDLPRLVVMRQLYWRTLCRLLARTELWNGNTEPWSNLWRVDPEQSILAWAWTRHRVYRQRYLQESADPANAQLHFIRLRTPAAVTRFLRQPPQAGQPESRR